MRKLVAALACRAGGTRLYGKPLQLLDLERGKSILDYMIEWLKTESTIHEIVLGVAEGSENETFHDVARHHGLKSIRGDQIDVLQRLIQCGEVAEATDIFRVTTESPFNYMEAIPEAWQLHCKNGNDMTTIDGLPQGSAFAIHTLESFKRSHAKGESRHRSELCALYIREHLEEFKVQVLEAPSNLQRLDLRLTVDYPEDLVLCRRIYEHLKEFSPRIPLSKIVSFLDTHAQLKELVASYVVPLRWFK